MSWEFCAFNCSHVLPLLKERAIQQRYEAAPIQISYSCSAQVRLAVWKMQRNQLFFYSNTISRGIQEIYLLFCRYGVPIAAIVCACYHVNSEPRAVQAFQDGQGEKKHHPNVKRFLVHTSKIVKKDLKLWTRGSARHFPANFFIHGCEVCKSSSPQDQFKSQQPLLQTIQKYMKLPPIHWSWQKRHCTEKIRSGSHCPEPNRRPHSEEKKLCAFAAHQCPVIRKKRKWFSVACRVSLPSKSWWKKWRENNVNWSHYGVTYPFSEKCRFWGAASLLQQ